jgi:hypothetical protein
MLAGLNPDLQKVCGLGGGWIELAMPHARSGAHDLNLPRSKDALISKAVAMRQRTFQNIAENFHVAVRMLGETSPRCDDVVIDHPKASEAHV